MNAHPVPTSRARSDLRWAMSQDRATAEMELRRHREIARIIDREQLQALGEEVIGQSMTYRRRGG